MQQRWVRFEHAGQAGFGTLHGDRIHVRVGDMFGPNDATGETLALADVRLLSPSAPTKVIALWNNFHALAAKLNLAAPAEPLYLLKAPNSWSAHGEPIRPPHRPGKVVFEGELAVVIGRTCTAVPEADAMDHVFGYTCVNDGSRLRISATVTSFAQV